MKKHIIAVTTTKGGVAKTSTVGSLAELAALDGRRVLAVDLDAQGALSVWYQASDARQTAYNAFSGGNLADAIRPTEGGFDLIPASGNLSAVTMGTRLLEDALQPIRGKYDFIILDAPPMYGALMFNALFASNEIICPLEADICAMRGFKTTMDIFTQAKQSKRNMRLSGALITRYDPRPNINRDLCAMIQEEAAANKVPFLGTVRKCVKIPEAQALGKPLFQYAPKCTAAEDYRRIYQEITKEG